MGQRAAHGVEIGLRQRYAWRNPLRQTGDQIIRWAVSRGFRSRLVNGDNGRKLRRQRRIYHVNPIDLWRIDGRRVQRHWPRSKDIAEGNGNARTAAQSNAQRADDQRPKPKLAQWPDVIRRAFQLFNHSRAPHTQTHWFQSANPRGIPSCACLLDNAGRTRDINQRSVSQKTLLEMLMSDNFLSATDPYAVFEAWLDEAAGTEPNDPNAASLATVDADGLPNVRVVLVKAVERSGFVFYTNLESAKGQELLGAGKAALCFHWKTLGRQIRVRGLVTQVPDDVADAYYASRPRGSRLGAWASQQSRPLEAPDALKTRVAELATKYGEDDASGKAIPRPPHWSGFRLEPTHFELWHDRPFRLHDRVLFKRQQADVDWISARLYP